MKEFDMERAEKMLAWLDTRDPIRDVLASAIAEIKRLKDRATIPTDRAPMSADAK